MIDLFANRARTTLASSIITTPVAGTVEVWQVAASGDPFPIVGITGDPNVVGGAALDQRFRVVVSGLSANIFDLEIVDVYSNANDPTLMTVSRGAEGSKIQTHTSGETITLIPTAYQVRHSALYANVVVTNGSPTPSWSNLMPIQPAGNATSTWGSVTTYPTTVPAAGIAATLTIACPQLRPGTLTLTKAIISVANLAGTQNCFNAVTPATTLASAQSLVVDFGGAGTQTGADLTWDSTNKCYRSTAGDQYMVAAQVNLTWVPA